MKKLWIAVSLVFMISCSSLTGDDSEVDVSIETGDSDDITGENPAESEDSETLMTPCGSGEALERTVVYGYVGEIQGSDGWYEVVTGGATIDYVNMRLFEDGSLELFGVHRPNANLSLVIYDVAEDKNQELQTVSSEDGAFSFSLEQFPSEIGATFTLFDLDEELLIAQIGAKVFDGKLSITFSNYHRFSYLCFFQINDDFLRIYSGANIEREYVIKISLYRVTENNTFRLEYSISTPVQDAFFLDLLMTAPSEYILVLQIENEVDYLQLLMNYE